MKEKKNLKDNIKFYGRYMGLATEMFGILFLAALGGQWLDKNFQTDRPYITAVLMVLALTGVLYKLIKDLDKK